MAKVFLNGNLKGGVGKTTNTVMEAYILAEKFNKRVCVVDLDPQANATLILTRTGGIKSFPMTLMKALELGDLEQAIINIKGSLDLIPSAFDFIKAAEFLNSKFGNDIRKKTFYLHDLIALISDNYDYIFLDVPPKLDIVVDNAVIASDYIITILETQELALDGAQLFVEQYLQTLYDDFKKEIEIVGVLPVLKQKGRTSQDETLKSAKELFGDDYIFNTIIKNHARLERYPVTGIQEKDHHDRDMMILYTRLIQEIFARINMITKTGDLENFSTLFNDIATETKDSIIDINKHDVSIDLELLTAI